MNQKITRIRRKLMAELDKERYEHTLGVMYTAASMAMRYDADIDKALMAGLLHDCAKCISGENKIKLCDRYHLSVSEVEKANPSLLLSLIHIYHKYSSVPILNREGKYVGSITEGDVLWSLKKLNILSIKDAEDISIMKIERRMDYQCVTAESNMEDLIGKAMEQNFVPVVDDQEHFIGIITRRDIIGYYSDKMKECDK